MFEEEIILTDGVPLKILFKQWCTLADGGEYSGNVLLRMFQGILPYTPSSARGRATNGIC